MMASTTTLSRPGHFAADTHTHTQSTAALLLLSLIQLLDPAILAVRLAVLCSPDYGYDYDYVMAHALSTSTANNQLMNTTVILS